MLSSEDLERFYFQYQTEAVPLGMSVQTFCLRNNVPYNIFHKWYKDTRKKIVEVQVDGVPGGASRAYIRGADLEQWPAYSPERSGLSGSVPSDPKAGGPMLSVTGINRFYYLRGFTDMRCKHSRVLSVIREQLHREPSDGDIYIVMSKDRRIAYRIDWKDVVLLLENPVIKSLKIR